MTYPKSDFIPKTRIGIVERKESTRQLELLFAGCDSEIKKMDALVDMLRYTDNVFYTTYYSARKIVSNGHRSLSILGKVVDENGNSLEKVNVVVKDTPLSRKTSENGVFEIKNLEGGIYQLVFTRPGYVETTVELAVTSSLTSDVIVTMSTVSSQSA